MEILVISGLSGSGKSKAASYLEDIGYYIVDNLPATSAPRHGVTMTGWRWCTMCAPVSRRKSLSMRWSI